MSEFVRGWAVSNDTRLGQGELPDGSDFPGKCRGLRSFLFNHRRQRRALEVDPDVLAGIAKGHQNIKASRLELYGFHNSVEHVKECGRLIPVSSPPSRSLVKQAGGSLNEVHVHGACYAFGTLLCQGIALDTPRARTTDRRNDR